MKKSLLALSAIALSFAPANAALVISQGAIGVIDSNDTVICDGVTDCNGALTGNFINFFSSIPGQAAALPGNNTSQIAVRGSDLSAILAVDSLVSSFSFDWGSVDTYNSINIFTSTGNFTVNGSDLPPANGNQNSFGTNFRFTAQFDAPTFLEDIEFVSTRNSFEFDNVSIAAVPEPATWAFMIFGFGAIGGALRSNGRRQRKANLKVSYA